MAYESLYTHGFARVAAAVPHLKPADPAFNVERTIALATEASEQRAALAVFPELGLSAYAIDDLLHQSALIDGVERALQQLLEASRELLPVLIVGGPHRTQGGLFNCGFVIHRGKVLGRRPQVVPARVPRVLRGAPVPRRARVPRPRDRRCSARPSRSATT